MIVLPQNGIGERRTVVHAPTHSDGVLLKAPQPGCRLPGVRDLRRCPCHLVHGPTSERGDPGEALQKIQGHPFTRQHRPRGRAHRGDSCPRLSPRTVSGLRLEAGAGIEFPKHAASDRQAGDDKPTFGDEMGDCRAVPGGAQQPGGNVLASAILGQGAAHLLETERVSQSPASDRWPGAPGARRRWER